MKCSLKSIFGFGGLLGLLLFALCMGGTSRRFYYLSGVWIGDVYVKGKGEAAIPAALLVGLISSVVMGFIYVFLFCSFYNWRKNAKMNANK